MKIWIMLAGLFLAAGCSDGRGQGPDTDAGEGTDADAPLPDVDAGDEVFSDADGPSDPLPDADADPLPDGDEDDLVPVTLFDEMVLSASDGRLTLSDGSEPVFSGAISCCGGGYGWPLVDEAWVDYAASRGVTFLHVRLGPFLTGPNGESDWAPTGGGYVEVDGRADLAAWNEAFWSRVRDLLAYAGGRGMWVEVDVWAVKHCLWGDIPGYSAWDAVFNVQGQDWCGSAGSAAVEEGSVHDLWIRKVVEETGRYGNVIYQDGNEVGLVDGYSPAWTISMLAVIRDVEAARGYRAHLFGTNSGHGETMDAGGVQYIELHQASAPDPAGCRGKPCLSNEYNPDPAMTPEEVHAQYCSGLSMGTYFWYWRHGQTAEQMDRSLELIQGGCG
jgi:hypothetical protein